MDKLGFNGDRGLYLFDFNRLKDVVSILEDDLQKSLTKEIGKKDNAKIAAAAMLAGTLAAGAAGAVSHLYNKKQESNKQLIETIKKAITQNPFQPIDSSSFKKYKRLQQNPPALLSRSHIVAGIVSATVLAGAIVGLFSSYHFASLSANKSENKWNNIFNLISAVKKINAYLKEEFTNAFSPYYELLDFIISDYHEEVVNGKVEAVFNYKMINKNYDRDPDTVEYIKEAKEGDDKYYQIYYDEYLQPKENNFYFKVIIDENDDITLYTKNLAIENDEWNETKMSDYIIKQP